MHYDVICVGAGVLGTFHAYFAAKKGKRVLLIERDAKPYEGTVRNFGQCVPSGQEYPRWHELGIRAMHTYKHIQSLTDISVRKNGSCYIASDEQEMVLLQEMVERNLENGYPSQLLSAKETLLKYPSLKSDYVKGSLFFPEEISLEPRLAIHKIIEFVKEQASVEYKNNSTVISCARINGKIELQCANKQIYTADTVFICSGREFKILYPGVFAQSGLRLSKLQMMITQPMPEVKLPGNILTGLSIRRYEGFHSLPSYPKLCALPKNEELENKFGIHILFKQAVDGSIIIGDSHEYADSSNTETLDFGIDMYIHELMLREAKNIMNLPNWNIQSVWNGYYSTHSEGIYNTEIEPGIHIVTGIGGKGMSTSAGFAESHINQIFQ